MSPLLIGGLLAGGLIILVCVGFISHSLERNRLERARQVAELNARIKLSRQAMDLEDMPSLSDQEELKIEWTDSTYTKVTQTRARVMNPLLTFSN